MHSPKSHLPPRAPHPAVSLLFIRFLSFAELPGGLSLRGGRGPPLLGSGGQSGESSVCADSRHSARRLIRRVVQSVSVTLSTRAPALLSRLAASISGNTAPPEVALSKITAQMCRGTVVKLNFLFLLVKACVGFISVFVRFLTNIRLPCLTGENSRRNYANIYVVVIASTGWVRAGGSPV